MMKGQFNIVGVIGALMTLLFLAFTMPIIMDSTNTMYDNLSFGGYPTAALATAAIPLFLILIAIMNFFKQGQGAQVYQ